MRRHPGRGMEHRIVGPRRDDITIAPHAAIDIVGIHAVPPAQIPQVVVLGHQVRVAMADGVQVAIVEHDVVEALQAARGVDVHLAHRLGVIARRCEGSGQGRRIIPRHAVAIADAAVVPLVQPGQQRGTGRNTARHRGVGVAEAHAIGRQHVEVGRLDDGMPGRAEAIGAPLVDDDQEDVWWVGHGVLHGRRAKDQGSPTTDDGRQTTTVSPATRCRAGELHRSWGC